MKRLIVLSFFVFQVHLSYAVAEKYQPVVDQQIDAKIMAVDLENESDILKEEVDELILQLDGLKDFERISRSQNNKSVLNVIKRGATLSQVVMFLTGRKLKIKSLTINDLFIFDIADVSENAMANSFYLDKKHELYLNYKKMRTQELKDLQNDLVSRLMSSLLKIAKIKKKLIKLNVEA